MKWYGFLLILFILIITALGTVLNFLLPSLRGSELIFGTKAILNSYLLLLLILAIAFLIFKKYYRQLVLIGSILICTLSIIFGGSELYLSLNKAHLGPQHKYDLNALWKYYHGFCIQHLHPYYIFSLPYEISLINKINNPVCSIDINGFRGQGPEERQGKKLAFLIGGSAAFGLEASSNAATITGFLNKHQSQYFFVNAGVPGWNSLQELYRLLLQLQEYNPDLIIVYDGHNDASISYKHAKSGHDYLLGTPDSYGALAEKVDDIRSQGKNLINISIDYGSLWSKLNALCFPEVRDYLTNKWGKNYKNVVKLPLQEEPERSGKLDAAWKKRAEATARNYLKNLSLMRAIAGERNIKIIFIFQPYLFAHQNKGQCLQEYFNKYKSINAEKINYINEFHEIVINNSLKLGRFYDFYTLFDKHYQDIPGGQIFGDEVHLYDRGNEIVAQEIVPLLP